MHAEGKWQVTNIARGCSFSITTLTCSPRSDKKSVSLLTLFVALNNYMSSSKKVNSGSLLFAGSRIISVSGEQSHCHVWILLHLLSVWNGTK